MKIAKTTKELLAFLPQEKAIKIGFVPTMGALHRGHLSLIESAVNKTDFVVVSLFVNPLQFNNETDLEKYPRKLESDIILLENAGCNLLFAPTIDEMYPENLEKIQFDLGELDTKLEGKMRKGHFDGVVQVLNRLFSLVNPNEAFFGLKDYQQCMVVNKLINTLFPQIKLSLEPTIREESGLAMSSRNQRLSEEGKQTASEIFKTLNFCKSQFPFLNADEIILQGTKMLADKGMEVEYLEIVESENLENIKEWNHNQKYIILAAVYLESVRLIDNLFIN